MDNMKMMSQKTNHTETQFLKSDQNSVSISSNNDQDSLKSPVEFLSHGQKKSSDS